MAPNSIDAARAQLAAKRAQREGESNFGPQSDFLDLHTPGPDTVFDQSLHTPVGANTTVAHDVSTILETSQKPESIIEKIEPLEKIKLRAGISEIYIKVTEAMQDNRFLDLLFIGYSSVPDVELFKLKDKNDGTIYVWNGKDQADGSILLILGERGENGKMRYRNKYDTKNGKVRLTFNHAKYE